MKRKFIFLLYMMLALSFASYAQTASIGSVSPTQYAVGDEIQIPVNVTGFTNIAAVTLGIGFDDQVITYTGFTSPLPGALCNTTNLNGPQVSFAWSSLTTQTLNPGVVLTMKFVYLGGTSDLSFNPTDCEVIQLVGNSINPLEVFYTDGEVPQTVNGAEVSLSTYTDAEIGDPAFVFVNFAGFGSNIGAVTLNISFNDDMLTFDQAFGAGPLANLLYYINSNVITITWNNGFNTTPINGDLIVLRFNYNGPSMADVEFEPECDIQTTGAIPLPVEYYNGSVIPEIGAISYIQTEEAFPGNTGVGVPVQFLGYPSNVGALTLNIGYDSEKLTFQYAEGYGDLSNLIFYSDDNQIYIVWSSTTGKYIDNDLVVLYFTYLGGGDTELTFETGSEITSNTATIINTTFFNGGIMQGESDYTVSLNTVTAFPNTQVTNTITFDGFLPIVGSMTLIVEYDDTKMTLQDITGTDGLSNLIWYTEIYPGGTSKAFITWSDIDGYDPDLASIDLDFLYLGGGETDLVFGPGCVISDTDADPIDISYFNGGISTCQPEITDQPDDVWVNVGDNAVFSVTATCASSYLWYIRQTPLDPWNSTGTTTPTLTSPPVQANWDGMQTYCLIQPGDVASDIATLRINPELNIRVYLEGPYLAGTGEMNTYLLDQGLVPLDQPYNGAPWNYAGTENVVSVPAGVVDWVYVELRDADIPDNALPGTKIWEGALFVNKEGYLVGLDGVSAPIIDNQPTINEGLFIVIRHRNHLDIMSNTQLTLNGVTYEYDFTDDIAKAYGGANGYKEIESGVFGMVGSDIDVSGDIFTGDYDEWVNEFGLGPDYLPADIDFDGYVFTSDYDNWVNNFGIYNPILGLVNKPKYRSFVP